MKLLPSEQYQPKAEELYLAVREEILALVDGARVEHIGSSAIPGSLSKGDVDVCVVVTTSSHSQTVATLEKAGYMAKGETLRTSELCMLQSQSHKDLALQVIAEGSEFEFFIKFRDALRNDASLVEAYNKVKLQYATSPAPAYRAAKDDFIKTVLRNL